MRLNLLLRVATSYCMLICVPSFAQDKGSGLKEVVNFPSNLSNSVNKKTTRLEKQLSKQGECYLQRLAKREKKLQRTLSKFDSAGAQQLFANSRQQYQPLTEKIKGKTGTINRALPGEYLRGMDSLKTSISFLQQNIRKTATEYCCVREGGEAKGMTNLNANFKDP